MPVDPNVRRFLDRLAALNPPSAVSLSVLERRNALHSLLQFSGPRVPVERVEHRSLPGPAGELPIRLYTPSDAPSEPLPGLIYFHGGGLIAGSLDTHDGICRSLTAASHCRVIAVDYRLAPEHPFPAAVEDAYAATHWIAAHAPDFGLDAARLAVGGDSAGATLAATVCQRAATDQTLHLALQLLLCPILDQRAQTLSRRSFAQGFLLDQATLDHDGRHYLGTGVDPADPRISPLRARDLSAVAPACIHTAQFDPVRDEGAAYAERLRLAGVPTTYHCHSGMIHLFYGMGVLIPYAATAYELIGSEIRAQLS
jgi:acetyl esterase/lipase